MRGRSGEYGGCGGDIGCGVDRPGELSLGEDSTMHRGTQMFDESLSPEMELQWWSFRGTEEERMRVFLVEGVGRRSIRSSKNGDRPKTATSPLSVI